MKKLPLYLIAIASLFLNSCSKELDGKIFIRINNQSTKPIRDIVVVSFSADGKNDIETGYGSVAPGSASFYRSHQKAWDFPLIKFNMQGYPPVEIGVARCMNGVHDLGPGNYSILILNENDGPVIRLVQD